MSDCPFCSRCWRHSYSRYLIDKGYELPPERMVLFCGQYASADMMPTRGIFAENMPLCRAGEYINLCPAMQCQDLKNCYEFCKESKRLAQLEKGRQRFQAYRDARPRVWIPKELTRAVAKRDHYRCVYCNRAQNQPWEGKAIRCHVDHFVPLAMGGHELDPNNLVLSCSDCNQAKGSQLWERGCRIGFYHEM